jgi:hypothetical protein
LLEFGITAPDSNLTLTKKQFRQPEPKVNICQHPILSDETKRCVQKELQSYLIPSKVSYNILKL